MQSLAPHESTVYFVPELHARLAKQGLDPAGGTPQALGERVKRELASWTRVVKAAHIKAD